MSSRTWFAVVACAVGAFFAACGGKVEEGRDTSTGGAAHGGSTGVGGHLTGGVGGAATGGFGNGGAAKGGSGLGGTSQGGWGGWGGSKTCVAEDPNDSCAVCAASTCCDAFVACDDNPVCRSMLECASYCSLQQDAGYMSYAECLTNCANGAGAPPEMDLLNDWYTCLCLQSCKGPCEYFKNCP